MDDSGSDCSTGEKSTQLLFHNVAEGILLDSERVKSILRRATVSDRLITESMSIFIDTATSTVSDTSGYKSGKLICVHNGAHVARLYKVSSTMSRGCVSCPCNGYSFVFGHFCPIKFSLSESFK